MGFLHVSITGSSYGGGGASKALIAGLAVLALTAALLVVPPAIRSTPAEAEEIPAGNWVQISAGHTHTCAVDSDGNPWCWGDNSSAQLGDGTTTDRDKPVRVSGLSSVSSISVGGDATGRHTCAIDSDGQPWCWGRNSFGRLGDGTTTNRKTPQRVSGLSSVSSISAGGSHTCAVDSDGQPWCWGNNFSAQLGDGTDIDRNTPVQVSGLSSVSSISAGSAHTCAVASDGQAWCWGSNFYGQLGNGSTSNRATPVQVSGLTSVSSISAGGFLTGTHTCAVDSDGQPWCWGHNDHGQLGDGTTTDRHTPMQVSGLSSVSSVSAGGSHTCVVDSDGQPWCWGHNGSGQLGDGTLIHRATPVRVLGLALVSSISSGRRHTCAVDVAGQSWCWGSNSFGKLGDGTNLLFRTTPTPVFPSNVTDELPDPPTLPRVGHPSSECTGGVVVADGFAGDTYVKLRGDQVGDETRLCFRADNDNSGFGGRIDISDPQGAGAVDTTSGFACMSAPVLDGEIGDPSDPATHVPFAVAVDDGTNQTVLCVRVDDFERSIAVSTSPDAVLEVLLDEPSTYATVGDWPAVPSASCVNQGGDRHVDVESFGSHVRLASYTDGSSQAQVCVRADGPVPIGGVLTVDTAGAPGVQPIIETASDRTPCTLNVLSTSQPATVEITRSPTGDIPASVCVRVPGQSLRVTVGFTGEPTLPSVTWTPDPNTPPG